MKKLRITFVFPILLVVACEAAIVLDSPEDLLLVIRQAETREIRESWGEEASQCFTWLDYETVVRANRPRVVAAELRAAPEFRELATLIAALSTADQGALLTRARQAARPTQIRTARMPDTRSNSPKALTWTRWRCGT
jgi:hypothetical protein